MADETLSSAVGLIVERSLVDAYIEVSGKKPLEIQGNESSRSDKVIVNNSNEALDADKLEEPHCKTEEAGVSTHRPDSTYGTKLISLNELPHDADDAETKSSNMEEKRDENLVIQPISSDYEASDDSEDTDELISIKQDIIIESNLEDDGKNRLEENPTHLLHYGTNADEEDKCQKIASSTPIKVAESALLVPCEGEMAAKRALLTDPSFNNKLSSNLAVMIGDISGIDHGVYSESFVVSPVSPALKASPVSSALHKNQQTTNEKTDTLMPSTLDLSDLDLGSVDSYKEFSIQDKTKSTDGNTPQPNGINELRKYYEKELQKLNHEKDNLVSILTSPNHDSTLIRLHFTEDAKKELEKRCFQSERRNHEIAMENRRLQSLCFELERKNRLLEADKAVLHERNFKIDQERRKTSNELSAVQELLSNSLSDRRQLEDELFYAKKKEFNSSSRLSDSDATLREVKEDLNRSKRESADKDEFIRTLTEQKQEIQSNLNEALEQISRLEDASSQRSREKDLFHKLLEEYEVLYNQHHRIRSLYNEAIRKLDDTVEDIQSQSSQPKGSLSITLPSRGNSYRKKWSVSPTSPSIKEEQWDATKFPKKDSLASNAPNDELHGSPNRRSPRTNKDTYNRTSLGGILSWETSKDAELNNNEKTSRGNNNNNITVDGILDKNFSNHSPRSYYADKRLLYHESSTNYPGDDEQQEAVRDRSHNKDESMCKKKDWVIHNVNGITRFDVVFSPSKFKYEEAERESPKEKSTSSQQDTSPYAEKDFEKEMDAEAKSLLLEISGLERDLTKLSAEKNEIESQLRRLPSSGSGRARRSNAEKQELLEERLDEVVKYIGNIRMTLKRHKAL